MPKFREVASARAVQILVCLIGAAAVVILAIWLVPEWLNSSVGVDPASKLKVEDWLAAKNSTRTSMVALLLAIGGVGTFLYTIRSYRLARTGQVTDRYTKAVEQLGENDKPQVRVGGVYALERIARDSPKDQRAVIDVLVAHIREGRPRAPSPAPASEIPIDIAAALQVLGRLVPGDEGPIYDLRELDLRGASLPSANFSRCRLDGTQLDDASLIGANLRGAVLKKATLTRAKLTGADLIRADLTGVPLDGADFLKTKVMPGQLTDSQKKSVDNWSLAELYTDLGGKLRPSVTHQPVAGTVRQN
jgi:hypothetical protein